MGLKAYLLKRLVYTIVLVFFVLTLNFIIFEALPGGNGAINNILGSGHRVSQVQIDYLYHLYGLDQPLYVRYYKYIDNMLTLQFGISLQNGHPSNPLAVLLTKIQYAFMPVAVLTLFSYGFYVLLTRATMIEALQEDYISTARAKGVNERSVLVKHAFRNASLPIVTSVALAFGSILGGAIITETVFNWPGLGLWTFRAIQFNDTPVLQTIFYLGAVAIIIANFVADILYGLIDPRIKYS